MEEAVYRERHLGAHAEHRGEKIRPRAQISLLAEEFRAVALRLERVIRSGRALDRDLGRLELERLLRAGGQREHAGDDESRADVLGRDLIVIRELLALEHNLKAREAGAVVEVDEAERLGVAQIAHPAAQCDSLSAKRGAVVINVFYKFSFH